MSGTDILAEQNIVTLRVKNKGFSVPLESEYNKLATGINDTNTLENIQRLKFLFEQDTGLVLHAPSNRTNLFGLALSTISRDIKQGTFPVDIKHVLIGHGMGSSLNKSWILEGLGFANGKSVNIFEYINKNILNGEKVLVCSCEEGATVVTKPGIGRHVELSLAVPTEPAKIVEAGKNEIIGHYTSLDPKFPDTGVVYY